MVDGKGIVTLWGVKMSDGTIATDGLSVDISSGVSSVQLSNFDPSYLTAGRIQISNGMSGTLTVKAGIGLLGSDFGANVTLDRKSTRLNSSHITRSRMPSSA